MKDATERDGTMDATTAEKVVKGFGWLLVGLNLVLGNVVVAAVAAGSLVAWDHE